MFAKYLRINQSCQGLSKKNRNHISCSWLITVLKSKGGLHPRAGIKYLVSPHTEWLRQLTLNVFIQRTENPSLVAAYIKKSEGSFEKEIFLSCTQCHRAWSATHDKYCSRFSFHVCTENHANRFNCPVAINFLKELANVQIFLHLFRYICALSLFLVSIFSSIIIFFCIHFAAVFLWFKFHVPLHKNVSETWFTSL